MKIALEWGLPFLFRGVCVGRELLHEFIFYFSLCWRVNIDTKLFWKVGIAGNNFEELYSLTRIQISSVEKTLKNFEEICEALISLLYFGFLYADTNRHGHIKSILTSFLEKCKFFPLLLMDFLWKIPSFKCMRYLIKYKFI